MNKTVQNETCPKGNVPNWTQMSKRKRPKLDTNVQKETSPTGHPTGHKWTKEQLDAIYEKGSNILVAAAAR